MSKRYWKALNSLYGDGSSEPSAIALPDMGSFSLGQKNRQESNSHSKPRKNIEAGLQMKLVAWLIAHNVPHYSIPNEGNRGQIATHRLKQMGLRPGASDLVIPRMRGGYGSFYVELKSPGEKPRPNQISFMQEMRAEGHKAEWFDNLADAQQSIIDYISGKDTRPNAEQL